MKNFKCEYCGKEFKRHEFLVRHLKSIHNIIIERQKYICHYCNKEFKTNQNLKCHINDIHERTNIFICEFCNKSFTREFYFKQHLKRKSCVLKKEQQYKCPLCHKSYTNKKGLYKHLKQKHPEYNIPKKIKQTEFICSYCNKIFKRHDTLKTHLLTHKEYIEKYPERKKVYICEFCGQIFSKRYSLHRHLKKRKNNICVSRKHSEETKQKISKKNKGKLVKEKNAMYNKKGKDHPAFGYRHSEESKKKISLNNSMKNPIHRKKISDKFLANINSRKIFSNKSYKDYILPSGKLIRIQGYENYILDYLLKNNIYKEEDFKFDKHLIVKYNYNGIKSYITDFFIPKQNLIIEVKSLYVVMKEFEKNKAKFNACINQGYNFICLIYNEKYKNITVFNDWR